MRRFRSPWVLVWLLACLVTANAWADGQAEDSETANVPITTGPETGTLVVVGGGRVEFANIFGRFIELAGGREAKVVIVPTASSSKADYDYANHRTFRFARDELGMANVSVLHTHDPVEADTEVFASRAAEADAVWFSGGRQWRLVDAYRGTRTEEAFRSVLARGGVIGGSSAGATIQGSFLVRGDTRGSPILIGDHQYGFGYIKHCAIDQHVIPRKRQRGLIKILTDSEGRMDASIDREALLGIGLDEDTAIIVRRNRFEVIGKPDGQVLIYDPRVWTAEMSDEQRYQTLFRGGEYDLARRVIVKPGTFKEPPEAAEGCGGASGESRPTGVEVR